MQRKSLSMIDIFVSYSRKDKEIVKKLVEIMQGRGWSVWWDPTIRPGEYFEDEIEEALFESKCVVVVWSQNSVKSKWVRAEAAEAANREVLVPVVIDDAKIPFRFKQIQEARLSDWQSAPDHPELIMLFESIAEKCAQAQNAPNQQPVSAAKETEARPEPPSQPHEFASPQATNRASDISSDDDREDESEADLIAAHPIPHTVRVAQAQPLPVQRQAVDGFSPAVRTRPSFTSNRNLVIAILIVLGLGAAGAIYLAAFRKSDNSHQGDVAQQNGPAKVSTTPAASPNTMPANSPSPNATPAASPAGSPGNVRKLVSLLRGKWQSQTATTTECECSSSSCFDIQFNKPIPNFCVEYNQIYVSAYFRLDAANNKAYLFFKDPGKDLGMGAARMPWDKFDRKLPLATIDLSDLEAQHLIYVTWHGFTEAGAAKQRWRQIGSGYQGTYLKR